MNSYGYDPFAGVEQFFGGSLSPDKTAPVTHWLRDRTKQDFGDYVLLDGHVIRAITPETAADAYPEAKRLPD